MQCLIRNAELRDCLHGVYNELILSEAVMNEFRNRCKSANKERDLSPSSILMNF